MLNSEHLGAFAGLLQAFLSSPLVSREQHPVAQAGPMSGLGSYAASVLSAPRFVAASDGNKGADFRSGAASSSRHGAGPQTDRLTSMRAAFSVRTSRHLDGFTLSSIEPDFLLSDSLAWDFCVEALLIFVCVGCTVTRPWETVSAAECSRWFDVVTRTTSGVARDAICKVAFIQGSLFAVRLVTTRSRRAARLVSRVQF